MEIFFILLLIVLNGIFAMAEIAIVTARKSRLQHKANEGDKNAKIALDLANNPIRLLSTIQIGITSIGIFAGVFGGATIAESLSKQFDVFPFLDPYSDALALTIVVAVITYLTLVIGEIVPKRLALSNPEKVASFIAGPMNFLSNFSSPLVTLLSISTDWIMKLLRIKSLKEAPISEEEIRALIKEGARIGILKLAEKDILERIFKVADKKVNKLMTPRNDIVWIDIDDTFESIRNKIVSDTHSYYPVCRGSLDKVIGLIRTEDILSDFLVEGKINLNNVLLKPLFVPESTDTLHVLEQFKKTGVHMALIVDEYGSIQGLVWLQDILEAIVGEIPKAEKEEEKDIVKREDGSYLVDGLVTIDEFKDYFKIKKIPGEKSNNFHSIGGLVMTKVGRIPVAGDSFEMEPFRFEVIDMDANRVDKVLVIPLSKIRKKH
ncbi:MAG: HlyC/CorC family transporter [Candidatus Roizmanbacteria bacterium]|nr:MAG: HlyC/CorC family transporter [Candidatus Roizmanbacteria bacterium]